MSGSRKSVSDSGLTAKLDENEGGEVLLISSIHRWQVTNRFENEESSSFILMGSR